MSYYVTLLVFLRITSRVFLYFIKAYNITLNHNSSLDSSANLNKYEKSLCQERSE